MGVALTALVLGGLGLARRRERVARQALGLAVPPVVATGLRAAAVALAAFGLVLLCNRFRGVPVTLLVLAGAAGLVHFLTRNTPFGRQVYAIGGNEEAAVLSGIPGARGVNGGYGRMGGGGGG